MLTPWYATGIVLLSIASIRNQFLNYNLSIHSSKNFYTCRRFYSSKKRLNDYKSKKII